MSKPFHLSVKALVTDTDGNCLVIRRSRASKNNAGMWDFPGGKCDPGESMEVALAREVREETGLHVQLTRVAGSTQWEAEDRVVAYMILEATTADGDVQLSEEHDDYQWVPRSQLTSLSFPEQFESFIADYSKWNEAPKVRTDDWSRNQIQRFREKRENYKQLAATLIRVLQDRTDELNIHAIVQARAKTIVSFAEKIQRPGKSYTDPVNELTDLCGARVIAHTLSEVDAICDFVEQAFEIYWEDSGDKAETLAASEFGYLSRHYIVSFKPGVFPTEIVPDELTQLGLKAEVQVRTILQHAWADTAHELSYKNGFSLPRRWQREFARLAAVLEEADRGFDAIATGLQEYQSSYGAYRDRSQLEHELQRQELVLEADPGNQNVAHGLGKLAMTLEDWQKAVDVLRPFGETDNAALLRDLGVSLCKLHRKDVSHSEFQEGQQKLLHATELDQEDVDAWASLAGTWRTVEGQTGDAAEKAECRQKAKDFYRRAFEADHSDPYPLGNYIEYEVADHPQLDVPSFFAPALKAATRRCTAQAQVGVNLPWAYFDLGKFNLLLRRPYESLGYYARGVDSSTASFQPTSALSSFNTLESASDSLPGFQWPREFLRLANAIRFDEHDAGLLAPTPDAPKIQGPVLIVAGYCGKNASAEHRELLTVGLSDFSGTVISGGTDAGISAVVGELHPQCPAVNTIGYTPETLPDGIELASGYVEQRHTKGEEFSLQEPLQYWADLAASQVPIEQVRLIVIGGGRISACECQMALALGVSTLLVDGAGTTVERELTRLGWLNHPRLQMESSNPQILQQFIKMQA